MSLKKIQVTLFQQPYNFLKISNKFQSKTVKCMIYNSLICNFKQGNLLSLCRRHIGGLGYNGN